MFVCFFLSLLSFLLLSSAYIHVSDFSCTCTCTHHSPILFTEATGSIKMISCHGNTDIHEPLYYRSIPPLTPVTPQPVAGGRRRREVRGRGEGGKERGEKGGGRDRECQCVW